MTDAIVLAGGDSNQEFLKKFGVNNRSLLVIHNKFMIEYVIAALNEVSSIKRIIVVGPVKELKSRIGKSVEEVVPPGNDPFESTLKGLDYLKPEKKVLVISSDIPLIKGEMIEDFFLRCSKQPADFYYPIVRKEVYQKSLANQKELLLNWLKVLLAVVICYLSIPLWFKKERIYFSGHQKPQKSFYIARILG